jgi:hypothetical protein
MSHYTDELANVVNTTFTVLRDMPDNVASARPSPDAWSIKEIIGHLIDSAANNHQRFIRGRSQGNLVFNGYAQEEWVTAQEYNTAPWPELLDFWKLYNLHLARVMKLTPESIRFAPHTEHNLGNVLLNPPADGQPATLDHLMADYVVHLKHHLKQIDDIRETQR